MLRDNVRPVSARRSRIRFRTAAVVVGLAVLPVTATACTDTDGDGTGDVITLPSATVELPTDLPTALLTELGDSNDSIQIGESVELTGTVIEDGPFLFELQPDGESETVPVLTVEWLTVDAGDQVTVSGRWVTFDAATLEEELGIDLDDEFVARYSDQRGVVATSVE